MFALQFSVRLRSNSNKNYLLFYKIYKLGFMVCNFELKLKSYLISVANMESVFENGM